MNTLVQEGECVGGQGDAVGGKVGSARAGKVVSPASKWALACDFVLSNVAHEREHSKATVLDLLQLELLQLAGIL